MKLNTQKNQGENKMETVKRPRMTETAQHFAAQFIDIKGVENYVEEGDCHADGWAVMDTKGNRYPKAIIQQFADFREQNVVKPLHGPAEIYDYETQSYHSMDAPLQTVSLTGRKYVGGFHIYRVRENA